MDANEDDINACQPMFMDIEANKRLHDIEDLLCLHYDIPHISDFYFVTAKNSRLVVINKKATCLSIYSKIVCVFEL